MVRLLDAANRLSRSSSTVEDAIRIYLDLAEEGLLIALTSLGYLYVNPPPNSIESDLDRAKHYYEIAADFGEPLAKFNLAQLYRNEGRYAEADELLRQSAEAGFADAEAALETGEEE